LSTTLVKRASAKSRVMVASGPMKRSTDECEAGQILGQHGIALVRHRRAALLAGREIFFRLEHFGALEMADLGRQPFDRRGDDAQRREEHGVTVARDDLR
jgi:hypothetical protein